MKHASDVLRISETQDEEWLTTPQMRGALGSLGLGSATADKGAQGHSPSHT